ncbi:MAG TPA: hypothetical protein VEK76_12445 [Candidatus Binatia bacterium]|nr:hypothetical protein [Candidatus Binatia bacterium]
MRRLIYIGQDDDISDLAGRIRTADDGDEVALVVPAGAQALQAPIHLRLIAQLSAKRDQKVVVVSPDPRIQEQARGAGVTVFSSVAAYEGGVPIELRRPGAPLRSGQAAGTPSPAVVPRSPVWEPDSPPAGSGAVAPGPAVASPSPLAAAPTAPAPAPLVAAAAGGTAPITTGPAAPAQLGGQPAPGDGPSRAWPATGAGAWGQAPTSWTASPVAPAATSAGWQSPGSGSPSGGPAFQGASLYQGGGAATQVPPAQQALVTTPSRSGRGTLRDSAARRPRGHRPRTALYFVLIGLAVIGLLVYLVLTPTATVAITVVEQPLPVTATIQGSADPTQNTGPNHILTKVVSDTGSQQFPATPTGTKSIPAVAATGSVVLSADPTTFPFGVSFPYSTNGLVFETSGGVQFEVTGSGTVTMGPPTYQSAPIPIAALQAAASGNVPAGAITQWVNDPCSDPHNHCPAGSISVTNLEPTSGGVDAATQTVASSSDIQGWQSQVTQFCDQLTSKARSDLTSKAGGDTIALDPNQEGETIACSPKPNVAQIQADTQMSPVTVTVTMTAQATVYNPADVRADVLTDLENSQNLPAGDTLVPGTVSSQTEVVTAASDGTVTLSVNASAYYRPATTKQLLSALRDQLTGRNPGDVLGIVQQRINDVDHVTVHESPFTLFFMPFFSSNIAVTENFVAPSASSSSG